MLSMTATMSLAWPSAVSKSPVARVGDRTSVAVVSVTGVSVYSKTIPPLAIVTSRRAFVKDVFEDWQFVNRSHIESRMTRMRGNRK